MGHTIESSTSRKRVVVVGAGIAGLAAAHRVVELAQRDGLPIDVTLLEGRERLGGNIVTHRRDGFLIEGGPDSFITQKPWGLALVKRLGLEGELIPTNPACRRTFVVRKGRMHPVPEGFLLWAPTRIWPYVVSRLFSWPAKLRMGLELFIPRKDHGTDGDESLSSFVTRRFGREALERVAQPLVSGIYTADPTDLSLRATMPRFLDMETRYGSLIKAMRRERKAAQAAHRPSPLTGGKQGGQTPAHSQAGTPSVPRKGPADSGARYSMFVSFARGIATLTDALAARLPAGSVRTSAPVSRVSRENAGWRVQLADGSHESADGVILACPAYASADMLRDVDGGLADELAAIRYASSATMSLAFRREQVSHPLDGFGFVVPVVESRTLIAATFSSVKFAGRAPDGWVLMRAFLGGAMQAHVFEMDDETLRTAVLRDLAEIVGVRGEPAFTELYRWPKSMPQYPVGHLDRVKRIEACLVKLPGLAVTGNAFGGVGIPDCVHSAETAAEKIVAGLLAPTPLSTSP